MVKLSLGANPAVVEIHVVTFGVNVRGFRYRPGGKITPQSITIFSIYMSSTLCLEAIMNIHCNFRSWFLPIYIWVPKWDNEDSDVSCAYIYIYIYFTPRQYFSWFNSKYIYLNHSVSYFYTFYSDQTITIPVPNLSNIFYAT